MNYLGSLVVESIRSARIYAGLSQNDLAEAAGVGITWLSDVENGRVSPRISDLEKLLAASNFFPEFRMRAAHQLSYLDFSSCWFLYWDAQRPDCKSTVRSAFPKINGPRQLCLQLTWDSIDRLREIWECDFPIEKYRAPIKLPLKVKNSLGITNLAKSRFYPVRACEKIWRYRRSIGEIEVSRETRKILGFNPRSNCLLGEASSQPFDPNLLKNKRHGYSEDFKLRVLKLAQSKGAKQASKKFEVSITTISSWAKVAGVRMRGGHSPAFRRVVVRYAQRTSVQKAAKKHGVSRTSVYNWARDLKKAPLVNQCGLF